MPEDLCLLRSPGDAWLATIAHERHAWFNVDWNEREALISAVPGLGELF